MPRSMKSGTLIQSSGTPANSPGGVRIGDGPMLTADQIRDILVVAGHPEPEVAAKFIANGTARPLIARRTAQDKFNEWELTEAKWHRKILLEALRRRLGQRLLEVWNETFARWSSSKSIAQRVGISHAHASNELTKLLDLGLVKKKLPGPVYRSVLEIDLPLSRLAALAKELEETPGEPIEDADEIRKRLDL